jgi:hypothetical protein
LSGAELEPWERCLSQGNEHERHDKSSRPSNPPAARQCGHDTRDDQRGQVSHKKARQETRQVLLSSAGSYAYPRHRAHGWCGPGRQSPGIRACRCRPRPASAADAGFFVPRVTCPAQWRPAPCRPPWPAPFSKVTASHRRTRTRGPRPQLRATPVLRLPRCLAPENRS